MAFEPTPSQTPIETLPERLTPQFRCSECGLTSDDPSELCKPELVETGDD